MENYLVLTNSEDGISIDKYDKDALRDVIKPGGDGDWYYGDDVCFLKKIPECVDGYFQMEDNEMCIIKYEVVIPKVNEIEKLVKVTEYIIE